MVPPYVRQFFGQSMTAGHMYTIAGSSAGSSGNSGNGGPATSALLDNPADIVVDTSGNVYFTDAINVLVHEVFH